MFIVPVLLCHLLVQGRMRAEQTFVVIVNLPLGDFESLFFFHVTVLSQPRNYKQSALGGPCPSLSRRGSAWA